MEERSDLKKGSYLKSPFSRPFRILRNLGAWNIDSSNLTLRNLHAGYSVIINFLAMCVIASLLTDAYRAFGNLKKLTFNMSFTILYLGETIKHRFVSFKNKKINLLRKKLHESWKSRTSDNSNRIDELALQEFKTLYYFYYFAFFCCSTAAFLIFNYNLTPELRFPLALPYEDKYIYSDPKSHRTALFIIAVVMVIWLVFVIEAEMAMFSLLIQISREYKVLEDKISTLDECYDMKRRHHEIYKSGRLEVNPTLKTKKTLKIISKLSKQQQNIIEYLNVFEECYNKAMFVHFAAASISIISVFFQFLLIAIDFEFDVIYEAIFLCLVIIDIFLLCWYSTRLYVQSLELGEAIYSTAWYKMDATLQKSILFMLATTQHPPRITFGKTTDLNLNVFMHAMKNIYSWLTVLRQFISKS